MGRPREFDLNEALDRAINYFSTHTYHEATVRELARYMRVSASSFYHTFGDKRRVYVEALKRYLQRLQAQQRQLYAQTEASIAGLRYRLLQMMDAQLAGEGDWGRLAVNATFETILSDSDVYTLLLDNQREFDAIFEAFFARCQNEGSISARHAPRMLGRFMVGVISNLTQRARLSSERQALEEIIEVALSALQSEGPATAYETKGSARGDDEHECSD